MGKIIKVGLIIAFLNGKYVKNFPQILLHEDMIKVGKRETLREDNISKLFVQEFKRILSWFFIILVNTTPLYQALS